MWVFFFEWLLHWRWDLESLGGKWSINHPLTQGPVSLFSPCRVEFYPPKAVQIEVQSPKSKVKGGQVHRPFRRECRPPRNTKEGFPIGVVLDGVLYELFFWLDALLNNCGSNLTIFSLHSKWQECPKEYPGETPNRVCSRWCEFFDFFSRMCCYIILCMVYFFHNAINDGYNGLQMTGLPKIASFLRGFILPIRLSAPVRFVHWWCAFWPFWRRCKPPRNTRRNISNFFRWCWGYVLLIVYVISRISKQFYKRQLSWFPDGGVTRVSLPPKFLSCLGSWLVALRAAGNPLPPEQACRPPPLFRDDVDLVAGRQSQKFGTDFSDFEA